MITKLADIRAVRPIAENINDVKRITPYIGETENLFLLPMIGAKVYEELDTYVNAEMPTANATFDILMAGGYYTVNDTRYQLAGLKTAMGYLVYSRFFRNQNVNVTAFGIVQKTSEFSDPSDERTVVRVANDAEAVGQRYLQECFEYLQRMDVFETCKVNETRKRKFKIIGQ